MNAVIAMITSPLFLEDAANLIALDPGIEGRLASAGLRMLAAALRAKKTAAEIDAITQEYSAQAQALADGW